MKTKGMTYARAKYALAAVALLAAMPVSAQVNFAYQESISFTGQDKIFATASLNYYAIAEPIALKCHGASHALLSSLPETYNKPEKESMYPEIAQNSLLLTVNMSNLDAAIASIRFQPTSYTYPVNCKAEVGIAEYSTAQIILHAMALKQYAKKNRYDTTYAFLCNMGMLSGKKRFFVVNLVTMQIEQSGLVAQGRGQARSRYDKQYSNIQGSKCTSLGRYRIMKKYKGSYGESYRLAGLDSYNKNAYCRNVVMHAMGCIPDEENSMPSCISEGCPAVSINFLSYLSKIIDSRTKPMLLWVFDSNLEEVMVEQKPLRIIDPEPIQVAKNPVHTCSITPHEDHDVLLK